MLFSILLIVLGIVLIAWVGLMIWHLVRGPDAQRRKALATLLINRLINRGRAAAGENPSSTARERRAIKHAAWSQAWSQRQHTHGQAHHAEAHQESFHSSHSAHSSGHHSSSHHGGSHHGGFDSGGHSGGHH